MSDPNTKPVIKAPVEREPVTNADFNARLINFIIVLWALFLYRSTKKIILKNEKNFILQIL